MSETLFSLQEHKIHIFEPTCNDRFKCTYARIQKLQKWIDSFMLPSAKFTSLLLAAFQPRFDKIWLLCNAMAWNDVNKILTSEDMERPLYSQM